MSTIWGHHPYINPSDKNIPASVAYLATENKNHEQKSVAYINPVDPRTGYQCKWEDVKNLYAEGVSHSEKAEVTLKMIESLRNVISANKHNNAATPDRREYAVYKDLEFAQSLDI